MAWPAVMDRLLPTPSVSTPDGGSDSAGGPATPAGGASASGGGGDFLLPALAVSLQEGGGASVGIVEKFTANSITSTGPNNYEITV